MNPRIRRLRERNFAIATRMREISDAALEEERGLTGDEENERQALVQEYDGNEALLRAAEQDAERIDGLEVVEGRSGILLPDGRDPNAGARGADGDEGAGERRGERSQEEREYDQVFERYLRFGSGELSAEHRQILRRGLVVASHGESRAMGTAPGSAGGYTVPEGFLARLIERRAFYGGMRQVADRIETESGEEMPFPTTDDTANKGAILAENAQAPEKDPEFGHRLLRAYVYTSKMVRIPYQLLWDNRIDLEGRLSGMLGRRIARAENEHFTIGTGSGQPEGFLPIVAVGKQGASGQTTDVNFTDLTDLEHAIDRDYREGARYMLADPTVGVLKKKLDGNGRPLWQPPVTAGEPQLINGYPFTVNNDVPVMAASARSIAFGDFRAGYIVRDVQGMQILRLEERFADHLQVGFLAFARVDGAVQDVNAIAVYQNAAG